MTWGSPRASLYVKCVGTVRAASHPPVWIHRKCELRSLKKTLNSLCLDDDYTIAQWLEHRWLQARVPGSSPGGDSQFFLQTFPVCLFPSKPVNNNNNNVEEKRTYGYNIRVSNNNNNNKDYLSDRTEQLIAPDNLPRASCSKGVPQGSVLGPVLFSIYVRGLPGCVSASSVLQFADDVNMYAAGDTTEEIVDKLNGDLIKLSDYLKGKRMKLNTAKTKFILLHRKTTDVPMSAYVTIDGVHVPRTQYARHLGIVLDENLTFGPQIDNLVGSVNRKLGAYRLSRHLLPYHARRTFYLSIIQSTLEDASSAYIHSLSSMNYDKFVRLFNRSLRIVFGFDKFTSASHILGLYSLYHIRCASI